jgi:metal transporter CNNM
MKLGDERAKKIYPVRKRGNLLLCTLLLGNVAVNSAMAIFLGDLASGLVAGVLATGLIVIFGEIIPQAVFSRYALSLGSKTVWLVKIFVFILYPIAYPISWVLDMALGDEMATIWNKQEIKEIIRHHEKSEESEIDTDEERILLGALAYSEIKVKDILTPKSIVFWLTKNETITKELLNTIKSNGYSRIPIFEDLKSEKLYGILRMSQLLGLNGSENLLIKDIVKSEGSQHYISDGIKLDDQLNQFILNKKHLSVVYNEFGVFLGIITLEDILEEILKVEILDEQDKSQDLRLLAMANFIESFPKVRE